MQITENKRVSNTSPSVRLSKTSKTKPAITPSLQQDYLLQLSTSFSIRINRAQYDSLLIQKLAVNHKDKKLKGKGNNQVIILSVIKLNPNLYGKCNGYYQDGNLQLEILPQYRNYVDKETAKALRSFFTLLLKLAPYRD